MSCLVIRGEYFSVCVTGCSGVSADARSVRFVRDKREFYSENMQTYRADCNVFIPHGYIRKRSAPLWCAPFCVMQLFASDANGYYHRMA